jgi:DedD protein
MTHSQNTLVFADRPRASNRWARLGVRLSDAAALGLCCLLVQSCSSLMPADTSTAPATEAKPAAQTSTAPCADCADATPAQAPSTAAVNRGEAQPGPLATASEETARAAQTPDTKTPPAETPPATSAAKPAAGEKPAHAASNKSAAGSKHPADSTTPYFVNVGAFAVAANASNTYQKVQAAGITVFTQEVDTPKGHLTRVRAGPFATRSDADAVAQKIRALDLDAIVLR